MNGVYPIVNRHAKLILHRSRHLMHGWRSRQSNLHFERYWNSAVGMPDAEAIRSLAHGSNPSTQPAGNPDAFERRGRRPDHDHDTGNSRLQEVAWGASHVFCQAVAARQSLQSMDSVKQLYSKQHLMASRALAFDKRYPAQPKNMGRTQSLGDGLPVEAYMLESYLPFILERSDGGGNYTGNFDPFRGNCLLGFSYMAYGPDMRKRVA